MCKVLLEYIVVSQIAYLEYSNIQTQLYSFDSMNIQKIPATSSVRILSFSLLTFFFY